MFCDCLSLWRLTEEIREAAEGARVSDIRQSTGYSLCLRLRRGATDSVLVLSAEARSACLHLGLGAFVPTRPNPGFCEMLRQRLLGGRLERVAQVGLDRVVELRFATRNDVGDPVELHIVVEVMGKHSNVILLDGERRIVDAVKRVPGRLNRHRVVLPRKPYVAPPRAPLDLASAAEGTVTDQWHAVVGSESGLCAADVLRRLVPGLGRLLIDEVCARASVSPDQDPRGGPRVASQVVAALLALRAETLAGLDDHPFLVPGRGPSAAPGFSPVPLHSRPEATEWPQPELSSLVAHCARTEVSGQTAEGPHSELVGRARRVLRQLTRRQKRLAAELHNAGNAELDRRKAQALLVNLDRVAHRATEVDLECLETGETLSLSLVPELSPVENAERYFAKSRKRRRALEQLPRTIAEVETRREKLAEVVGELEEQGAAASEQELERLLGGDGRPSLSVEGREPGEKSRFVRHALRGGIDAYLGRNARDNEALLSKVARPDDLWFHARGLPGPHGILRTADRSKSVPAEALREMARLMARQGKARHQGTVAVDYAPAKYVRKLRGGRPGAVTYTRHKTLFVKNR